MVSTITDGKITTITDTGDSERRKVFAIALAVFIAILLVWYLISGMVTTVEVSGVVVTTTDTLRVAIFIVVMAVVGLACFLLGRSTKGIESVEARQAEYEGYGRGREDLERAAHGALSIANETISLRRESREDIMRELVEVMRQGQGAPSLSAPRQPIGQLTAPAIAPREAFVAMRYVNGKTPGQVAVDRIRTRVENPETHRAYELTCKPATLEAAAAILRAGAQPVRTAFNAQGVTASDDIRDAIAYLRASGWIKPANDGSPARWVDGIDANSADELDEWVGQVVASAEGSR